MRRIFVSTLCSALLISSIALVSTDPSFADSTVSAKEKVTQDSRGGDAKKKQKLVTLKSLVENLAISSRKNFTLSYRTDGEIPGSVAIQDKTHFITEDYKSRVINIENVSYQRLNTLQLLLARRSDTPDITYMLDTNMNDAPSVISPILAEVYLVAKYGVVVARDKSTITVTYDFEQTPLSPIERIYMGDSMIGTLTYKFSQSRITSITAVEWETLCDIDCDYSRVWRFSYAPVKIVAPTKKNVYAVSQVDFPLKATPLEIAAYGTASQATALALEANRPVTVYDIIEAATLQATPEGLVAEYTATGLKFALGSNILYIHRGNDNKYAVVIDPNQLKTYK